MYTPTVRIADDESQITAPQFNCNPTVLTSAQQARSLDLREVLKPGIVEVKELPDGYRFRFKNDVSLMRSIGQYVNLKRQCCPYLTYGVRIEREREYVWLQVTGRIGIKGTIRQEFGI